MNVERFVHENLTDCDIERYLSEPISAGVHYERNLLFREILQAELTWRNETCNHYTLKQRIRDIEAHHAHIIAQRERGVTGYIPPVKLWFQTG